MPFNDRIFALWAHEHDTQVCGKCIPKFVIEPGEQANVDVLFLTFNPARPKRVSRKFRDWMQNAGWGIDFRERFSWENSCLRLGYDQPEADLSAQIHHVARSFYPRFFRRLNDVAQAIGMQPHLHLGVEMYDYAHLDLYLWLDSSSQSITSRIREDHRVAAFGQAQKEITFELLQAWRPKTIICPYKIVRPDVECFCRRLGAAPGFQQMPGGFQKIQTAKVVLPWGPASIVVCQNLLSARGAIGVNPQQFPIVRDAVAQHVRTFLGK